MGVVTIESCYNNIVKHTSKELITQSHDTTKRRSFGNVIVSSERE